jgi:phage terminase large subunit-like protein
VTLAVPPGVRDLLVDPTVAGSHARRELTRDRPDLFGRVYFPDHLHLDGVGVSFSAFHRDLCRKARRWMRQDLAPAEAREAWVAPRGSGKSTWVFLILSAWALAHRHRKFIAAYADTATQAEQHLATLKREFDTNPLLRLDFPELCTPAKRPSGSSVSDNQRMFIAESGAVIMARGIDSSTLGAKVGSRRPDLLLFDDIEPEESNYSVDQKEKRLNTILSAVFPMNLNAVVLFCGTTTMPQSIIHDLVCQVTEKDHDERPAWPQRENISVNYYPALLGDGDGELVSLWPQRWSTTYLQSIAHTRAFALNYMNNPLARDGDFWTADDFHYRKVDTLTHQLLSIDPAVTSSSRSDFTALAVIGYSAVEKIAVVRHVRAVKVPPGEQLRSLVLRILDGYPDIAGIMIESNQGGDTWKAILHHMPVPVKTVHQRAPKEVRAADLLAHYQRGRVFHEQALPAAEGQMVSFPKGANDDLVDAIGAGVQVFLGKKKTAGVKSAAYV